MFKQMVFFRFEKPFNISVDFLSECISRVAERHCGATEKQSVGWDDVNGMGYVHTVSDYILLRMRIEKRDLPAAVVKKELNIRCKHIENQMGRKPGKKEKKELKESIELEMLPRAFVKEKSVLAWIHPGSGMMGVEAGSLSKGEMVVAALYECVKGFPVAMPFVTEHSALGLMTGWLANGEADGSFGISDECELVAENGKIRYSRHTLQGQDVKQFLTEGKQPAKLGLSFDEMIEYVVDETLGLKKIALIDFESTGENEAEVFDAVVFATLDLVRKSFLELVEHCGGVTSMDGDVEGFEE